MIIRKIPALLLCLVLLLGIFAGCGGDGTTAETPDTQTESPADETPADDGADTTDTPEDASVFPLAESHVFSCWHSISQSLPAEVGSLNELTWYKALEQATNVVLEFTSPPAGDAGLQQFTIMVAGGDYCDLYQNPQNYYSGGISEAVAEELVIDVTELVNEYMPNYKALLDSDSEFEKACRMPEGGYGMIYGSYVSEYPPDMGLWMRKDLLDDLGEDIPETYDELHDVLSAFKTEYDLQAPLLLAKYGIMGNYLSAGYDVASFTGITNMQPFYVVDGEIKYGPYEDGYREYVSMLADWFEEGILDPDFMTVESQMPDLSMTDEFGLALIPVNILSRYTEASAVEGYELVGVGTFTKNAGDETHMRMSSDKFFNEGFAISAECSDPVLAAQYLDYWFSDEGYLALNYGIEGETYYIDDDGNPQYTDAVFAREDLTVETAILLVAAQRGPFVVNWDRQSMTYNDAQTAARQTWLALDNSYAIPSYVKMTTEESTAYSELYAEVLTLVSESTNRFIIGELDVDSDWDEYIETLEELGVKDCIACWQSAYDRVVA